MTGFEKLPEKTFAQRLKELMEQHAPPMEIIDLSAALDMTYEHTRRMVRGLSIPSRFVIRAIANVFNTDSVDLETIAKLDKFRRMFGLTFPAPILDSAALTFPGAWPHLTDIQKTNLLALLLDYVEENSTKIIAEAAAPSPSEAVKDAAPTVENPSG